ncbi:DUF456 domain-containing protein [Natronosalvus vescus]|uniref:DUF456 domain-containing protein n=1 Tax=Natronosalvus vescus TaxID=2953881 RepID=UPI0020902E96|nr:DUF456 domain-containing protein [Natronosalvus vescus]
MSERSDETTVSDDIGDSTAQRGEPADTETLLEQTDRLLDGESTIPHGSEPEPETSGHQSRATSESGSNSDDGSRLRLRNWRAGFSIPSLGAPSSYFSPKAFLVVLLTLAAGMVAGGVFLPLGGIGRIVGIVVVAFVIGLLTTKRRYLELASAGAAVGVVGSLFDFALLLPTDAGQRVLAIGAGAGLLATVVSYYFGRDLRNGLSRDLD